MNLAPRFGGVVVVLLRQRQAACGDILVGLHLLMDGLHLPLQHEAFVKQQALCLQRSRVPVVVF